MGRGSYDQQHQRRPDLLSVQTDSGTSPDHGPRVQYQTHHQKTSKERVWEKTFNGCMATLSQSNEGQQDPGAEMSLGAV